MTGTRWTLAALGLWVAASAFMGFGAQGYLWNNLLAGLLVLVLGIPLIVEMKWEAWVVGGLGLWLMVAAFVPGLVQGAALSWNNTLVGLIIATAAFIVPKQHPTHHVPGHA
ncbi:MAG: SPW repeat protein [Gemmatimonadota bacterium]